MNYRLKSKIVVEIATSLRDSEVPSVETMEHLVMEDLQDAGYDVYDMETLAFTETVLSDD